MCTAADDTSAISVKQSPEPSTLHHRIRYQHLTLRATTVRYIDEVVWSKRHWHRDYGQRASVRDISVSLRANGISKARCGVPMPTILYEGWYGERYCNKRRGYFKVSKRVLRDGHCGGILRGFVDIIGEIQVLGSTWLWTLTLPNREIAITQANH